MHKKREVISGLLVLITLAFAATGCYQRVRVGDLQTKSQTVELDDADSVKVEIQMGAGKLDVSGEASELLEATFTYNVAELKPRATYTDGRLEVKDSGVSVGIASLSDLADYRCEWDLKLNDDVPMEMNIDLGAGSSNLALGALDLTSLNVNGGAGEVNIDLAGDWQHDLDAKIIGGVGNINLSLPRDIGVRIVVNTGIGVVDADGFTRNDDTYTNDAYGHTDVTMRIQIDGGVGMINLDIE